MLNRNPALFAFIIPVIVVVMQFGACLPVDALPDNATNEVGTTHEVTATQTDEGYEGDWFAFFMVISGPNGGQNSVLPCEEGDEECFILFVCLLEPGLCNPCDIGLCDICDIACDIEECEEEFQGDCPLFTCDPFPCIADDSEPISWTYRSNGQTGTDWILVCASEAELRPVLFENLQALGGILGPQFGVSPQFHEPPPGDVLEDFEAAGCDIVFKTWEDEDEDDESPTRTPTATATKTPTSTPTITPTSQPSRLGVVDAIFPSQRATSTPVPAAAVAPAAPPAPAPQQQTAPAVVRPPSTGDGALR